MKYLLGLFCLQWDRPNHTMYYEELLPRNVQNRILFFTGVGYYKTVQSEHGATFFQFFLIKVIQIFQCWSQIIIQTRSEDIAIINVHVRSANESSRILTVPGEASTRAFTIKNLFAFSTSRNYEYSRRFIASSAVWLRCSCPTWPPAPAGPASPRSCPRSRGRSELPRRPL